MEANPLLDPANLNGLRRITPSEARPLFDDMLVWLTSLQPPPEPEFVGWGLPRFAYTATFLRDAVKPGDRVLDIGSEPYASYLMSRALPDVHIIPSSAETGSTEMRAGNYRYCYEPVPLLLDKRRATLPSADVVTMWEVLEHFPWHPAEIVGSIAEMLPTGGALVLSTPNLGGISPIYRLADRISPHQTPMLREGLMYHRKEYTVDEVTRLLEWAGFRVDRVETPSLYRSDLRGWSQLVYRTALAGAALLTGSRGRVQSALRYSGSTQFVLARKVGDPKWGTPPLDL